MASGNTKGTAKRRTSSQKRRRIVQQLYNKSPYCHYCQRSFKTGLVPTIDHFVPLCLGGDNSISNLVLCCGKCNSAKGGKWPTEELLAELREWW